MARTLGWAVAGAILGAAAPLVGPILVVAGGFLPALRFSNAYYALPRRVFGAALFPVHEFGVVPTAGGLIVAGLLYAAIGFAAGTAVAYVVRVAASRER